MTKTIVVVDKTGRGHSICCALTATNLDSKVHYLPGTSGFFDGNINPVPDFTDAESITNYCRRILPDVIFISHIDPLTNGFSDHLREAGFPVFGASAAATQLESSKWFCKDICLARGVSTPRARIIYERDTLVNLLDDSTKRPFMVKADWLTRNGNGAIAATTDKSTETIMAEVDLLMVQNQNAPFEFLVEEFVEGYDYSSHFFVNETSVVALPSSQDFKRSHFGGTGANCDGMGSISPHQRDNEILNQRIEAEILKPILAELLERGIVYVGPIYLGLRIDDSGNPHLIEINARMGDSESQTIFSRISEDLSDLIERLAKGETINRPISVRDETCMTLTLTSGEHRGLTDPKTPCEKDWPFQSLGSGQSVRFFPNLLSNRTSIHWANVCKDIEGRMVTGAGRIAHVTALGKSLTEARQRVYASIDSVCFSGKRWRSDIGIA